MQSIQEGITALKVLIGNLEETGSDLVKLSGPGEGSASVEEKVAVCLERYERLQQQTEERGIKIGMTLAQEEELQNRLDELQALLERRKEEFGNLKPISVRPDIIREQIEELKVDWIYIMNQQRIESGDLLYKAEKTRWKRNSKIAKMIKYHDLPVNDSFHLFPCIKYENCKVGFFVCLFVCFICLFYLFSE